LLIAQGKLSESDRPHCVHWTILKRIDTASREEIAKVVDADEMLEKNNKRLSPASVRMSDCFDGCAHCFFHCFPLFLRRRIFSRPREALHCNCRAFSIVDRLYFSQKFSLARAPPPVGVFDHCTQPASRTSVAWPASARFYQPR